MRNVPKIVLARLQRAAAVRADFHPDADLLTAFAERSLQDSEREPLMDHLARCGECRDVIALALPVSDNAVRTSSSGIAGSRFPLDWLSLPVLRWGVVAAALALVTSVGMLEYNHRSQQSAAVIAPLQQQKVESTQKRSGAIPDPVEHRAIEKNGVPSEIATLNQVPVHRAQNQMSFAQGQSDNRDVVRAKDPLRPQAAVGPGSRWSISSTGALQRSSDEGATWQDVDVAKISANDMRRGTAAELKEQEKQKEQNGAVLNAVVIFRAVTALGPEVWAGGNSMMLYHSLDSGSHWMRVEPLEKGISPAGDIVTMEFSDRLHGKFLTSDGELWTTSDDGQTWHKQ